MLNWISLIDSGFNQNIAMFVTNEYFIGQVTNSAFGFRKYDENFYCGHYWANY